MLALAIVHFGEAAGTLLSERVPAGDQRRAGEPEASRSDAGRDRPRGLEAPEPLDRCARAGHNPVFVGHEPLRAFRRRLLGHRDDRHSPLVLSLLQQRSGLREQRLGPVPDVKGRVRGASLAERLGHVADRAETNSFRVDVAAVLVLRHNLVEDLLRLGERFAEPYHLLTVHDPRVVLGAKLVPEIVGGDEPLRLVRDPGHRMLGQRLVGVGPKGELQWCLRDLLDRPLSKRELGLLVPLGLLLHIVGEEQSDVDAELLTRLTWDGGGQATRLLDVIRMLGRELSVVRELTAQGVLLAVDRA